MAAFQIRRGARQQAESAYSESQGSFQQNAANIEWLDDGGSSGSVNPPGRGRGRGYRGRWQRGNGGGARTLSSSNAGYQEDDDVSSNHSGDAGASENVTYGRYCVDNSTNNSNHPKPAFANLPDPMELFNFLLDEDEFRSTVAALCPAGVLAPKASAKSLSAYLQSE
jgi:hypothetical protein